MDKKTEEKVVEKAVEYYFDGLEVEEAVSRAMNEINKEYETR